MLESLLGDKSYDEIRSPTGKIPRYSYVTLLHRVILEIVLTYHRFLTSTTNNEKLKDCGKKYAVKNDCVTKAEYRTKLGTYNFPGA